MKKIEVKILSYNEKGIGMEMIYFPQFSNLQYVVRCDGDIVHSFDKEKSAIIFLEGLRIGVALGYEQGFEIKKGGD